MTPTLLWFDYETFGRSPAHDRLAQFAGLRTDLELRTVEPPVELRCRVADDYLPDPGACRVTGLAPRDVADGLPEHRFVRAALGELGRPGTVSVGYNSVGFDDEFTRFAAHRCFEDPYAHEYKDGASRWDLLDVVRLTRALRPDGIEWPVADDGRPTVRLEALAAANGIEHGRAHDALSDVEATLGVARLLRAARPRLYDWCFARRDKASVAALLDTRARPLLLLAAGTVPAARDHLAAIVPVLPHPSDRAGVVVLDLDTDPDELVGLDERELRRRAFSRADELGDETRIGLRTVRTNRCPALAPFRVLRPEDAERLGLDRDALASRRDRLLELLAEPAFADRLARAATRDWPAPDADADVDGTLYTHGFLSRADRARLGALLSGPAEALARSPGGFEDARLDAMLWRYKARNLPGALDADERTRWRAERDARLHATGDVPWRTLAGFDAAMAEADWSGGAHVRLREALLAWRREVAAGAAAADRSVRTDTAGD